MPSMPSSAQNSTPQTSVVNTHPQEQAQKIPSLQQQNKLPQPHHQEIITKNTTVADAQRNSLTDPASTVADLKSSDVSSNVCNNTEHPATLQNLQRQGTSSQRVISSNKSLAAGGGVPTLQAMPTAGHEPFLSGSLEAACPEVSSVDSDDDSGDTSNLKDEPAPGPMLLLPGASFGVCQQALPPTTEMIH